MASEGFDKAHVTAYRHVTKCRLPSERLPRFFRTQVKDYAEAKSTTCGFFVHRNASSHAELTFYSRFFRNIDGRLISTEYPEPRTS